MKIVYLFASLFLSISLFAQQPAKKALSISDFAGWETVSNSIISNDGKNVAYEQNPQKGDGALHLVRDKTVRKFPRGNKAVFGAGNNFIAFQIAPPDSTVRKAKLDKVKKEKMPKDSLGIFIFGRDSAFKFAELKSFKISEENSSYVAFTLETAEAKKDSAQNSDTLKVKKPAKKIGDDLVLFSIKNADTLVFNNVTEYSWSKNGSALYFIQQTKDSTQTFSRLSVFEPEKAKSNLLYRYEGFLKSATPNEQGTKYAFLASLDTTSEKSYSLYLGDIDKQPEIIVDGYTSGIPVGWTPSGNGKIYFSEDATKLYFGTAETPVQPPKYTIPEDEKPKLDVWSWKDLKLQPQQKVELEKEKKRTYLAVYHLNLNRFIQLADLNVQEVSTIQKGNGNIGLGYDESPYLRESSWTGDRRRDYYLVDFESGIKREIVRNQSYVRLSPEGKFVLWYDAADSSYYAKSTQITSFDTIALTKIIPVKFYNERHDTPSDPSPYGIAGWSEDDRFVYIYDRYDIWKTDPSGERVPVNMTKAFGRRNETRLRYEKLDKELEYIPTNEPILLNAFDENTMSAGFFQAQLNSVKDPLLLIMDKFHFGGLAKAKDSETMIWTKENVAVFPDLWRSNMKFERVAKLSDANLQQKNFVWPEVELVEWYSFTGENLQGLLYKPENLDPNKKYPMVVYFYERNAETLFRHQRPYPSHSTINKTFYASNGCLVFVPDITYKDGYPGQSAYNAIVSGTQYLINQFPFVDKDKIALQGQSWGGYQTAYLITQTDMYAAAMAGAPVSNMTSAYGGIRWQSGMSRMFQYEHTQSRIGGTLWDKPLQYIENSPLFYAPKVNTPLLMMHNDDDGAVPWYQGIEFFVALRRLNKPVWMLTYNGEPHNLKPTSWANRIDLSTRMFQFFNHYLKGWPAPEWMEKGIPAVDKGEKLGYE